MWIFAISLAKKSLIGRLRYFTYFVAFCHLGSSLTFKKITMQMQQILQDLVDLFVCM